MTLRCKPGDLCVIVSATNPQNRNRFVTVLPGEVHHIDGYECWLVHSPTPMAVFGGRSHLVFVPDAWMRPIRDPGEDAQDETLQWQPVPTTDEVPA